MFRVKRKEFVNFNFQTIYLYLKRMYVYSYVRKQQLQ